MKNNSFIMNKSQSAKYSEAKDIIENSGGKIISQKYLNSKTLLKFKCGYCNNTHSANLTSIRRSKGFCPNCRYERSRDKLNLGIKNIEKIFNDNNCKLISKEYKNINTKLKYICSCGREAEDTLNQFKKNKKCKKCIKEELLYNKKIKYYNKTKRFAENNNCILLTSFDEYEGVNGFVEFVCPECNKFGRKRLQAFYRYPICNSCANRQSIEKRSIKYDEVKKFINKNGCKLLTNKKDYIDTSQLLSIKCSCGKIYQTTFIYFKHEHKRQCNECGIKMRSNENSPFWKGGISSERDKIRRTPQYKNWRETVFKRDNYTCQCCGDNRGHNLQAHHIINYSENRDLQVDINNGITLCKNCHNPSIYGSFHHTYGTRNNTREQLEEYIEWYQEDVKKIIGM